MTTYTEFSTKQIDAAYINALVDLINACRKFKVELDKVQHFQNGWRVTFKGYSGDAICHDGSYGSPNYAPKYHSETTNLNDWEQSGPWETIGFPWDGDDVSVHDALELAAFIASLNDGEAIWEEEE